MPRRSGIDRYTAARPEATCWVNVGRPCDGHWIKASAVISKPHEQGAGSSKRKARASKYALDGPFPTDTEGRDIGRPVRVNLTMLDMCG